MRLKLHAEHMLGIRFTFKPENPADEYLIEQIGSYRNVFSSMVGEAKALVAKKRPISWSDYIRLVRQEQYLLPDDERSAPSTVADWVALYNDSVVMGISHNNIPGWRQMTNEETYVRLVMSYKAFVMDKPSGVSEEEENIANAAWAVSILRKHKIEKVLGI